MCFTWSEFVTYSYNDKLRVTNFEYNERVLEGAAFSPVVYIQSGREISTILLTVVGDG